MKTPKQRFPNYVPKPSIPLCPHNNEISPTDARREREALRSTRKVIGRTEHPWEKRIWNALHESKGGIKWSKDFENDSGYRIYLSNLSRVRVKCCSNMKGITLNVPSKNGLDWYTICISDDFAISGNLSIIAGVVRDAIDFQKFACG